MPKDINKTWKIQTCTYAHGSNSLQQQNMTTIALFMYYASRNHQDGGAAFDICATREVTDNRGRTPVDVKEGALDRTILISIS